MRFKQEIVESQVFDRLKFELGMKNFMTLIKEKLVPIPMDLVSSRLACIVAPVLSTLQKSACVYLPFVVLNRSTST